MCSLRGQAQRALSNASQRNHSLRAARGHFPGREKHLLATDGPLLGTLHSAGFPSQGLPASGQQEEMQGPGAPLKLVSYQLRSTMGPPGNENSSEA